MGEEDNILSFDRDAGFFLKAGRKQAEEGNLVRALSYLNKAREKEPGSSEIVIALAETLNRMQRFEESIRTILSIGSYEELPGDGIFGLASNFIALEEFGPARLCLEQYLLREPEGAYAQDAEDYLDLMDDEQEMCYQLGLEDGEDTDLISHVHFAKSLHTSGKDKEGLKYLCKQEARYPDSLWLQMEIAIIEYCSGDYKECEQRLFNILKKDSRAVRAKCLLALLRETEGKRLEAKEMLSTVPIPEDGDTEALGNLLVMLLELEEFPRAEEAAEVMAQMLPYDSIVLHELGYAKYRLGKIEEAKEIYRELQQIDPGDTVAGYYLEQLKLEPDPEKGKGNWIINYDVPYKEAFRRIRKLGEYFGGGIEDTKKRWAEDGEFRDLLTWALYSPLSQTKQAIFTLLGAIGDSRAESIVRDYLLRMDQSDENKQRAFAALQLMEGKEPYALYYNGVWQYGALRPASLPEDLPISYQAIFHELSQCEEQYSLSEGTAEVAQRIFYYYVVTRQGDYPRLNRLQETAMAAAFVLMALHAQKQETTPEEVCGLFGVSMRRLNNALRRIFQTLEKEKPEA